MAVPIWQAGFLGWRFLGWDGGRLGGGRSTPLQRFWEGKIVHHAVTTDTPQHTP